MNRKFILILLSVVAAIALLVFAVACGRTVTVTFDEGGATKTVSVKKRLGRTGLHSAKGRLRIFLLDGKGNARSLIFRSR